MTQPFDNTLNSTEAHKRYQRPFYGLTSDYNYCEKHRAFFANNPEYVFTQKNFVTSYSGPIIRKTVLGGLGNDIHPEISDKAKNVAPTDEAAIQMRSDTSLIVTIGEMFYYRQINTQFSCLGQMSDHIPGHDSLYRKDYATRNILNYVKGYESRPQCLDAGRFFPKTFALRNPQQCKEFFKIFNSEEYEKLKAERGIVYFRKVGADAHGAEGVFPVDDQEKIHINTLYQNGKLCGQNKANNLLQHYIYNPLLLNDKKFDFRVFMLVASSNPFIVYYHDGFLRVSLTEYDPVNNSQNSLMPNHEANDEIIRRARANGTLNGKTVQQIKEDYMWSFERLEKYLLENGKIEDPNWLENYLRPELKKAMVHIIRMSQFGFQKISSVYELYGVDFILDENLNLWFIEANSRPAIEGITAFSKELFTQLYWDQYEIVFAVLRSRMKRVYEYVNKMIFRGEALLRANGEVNVAKALV